MGHSEPMAQVETELVEYFDGKRAQFEVALAEHGSSFERAVWADLRAIPAGQTRSYGAIAAAMGHRVRRVQWRWPTAQTSWRW